MPRRSTSSTEKAVETTPVERRSTRASTRKSIEVTPTPTPEKKKTEKSPVVKSSPAAHGKRGRPSKRQSGAAAEDDTEQATGKETKMDVATADSEPEAKKVEDVPSNLSEKLDVKEDSTEKSSDVEKVDEEENKKRQHEDDSEAGSVKKHRPEDAADKEKGESAEKKEETVAVSAEETTKESSGVVVESATTEPKIVEPEAALNGTETAHSKEDAVTEVASKKALVSDSEVVQTAEDSKQNGCLETAVEPTAHVGC